MRETNAGGTAPKPRVQCCDMDRVSVKAMGMASSVSLGGYGWDAWGFVEPGRLCWWEVGAFQAEGTAGIKAFGCNE